VPGVLQDVLDRRAFAMPYVGTWIGDEDYPRLNPADPDERGILVKGEHPEWHDLLADPSFDGEVDGVNPRLHLAMHEIVANQLWDDDPPEAWRAAQRLLAAGADRHDVLHQLGGAVMEHLYTALTAGEPVDPVAYRKALDGLGARKTNRPRRAGEHATALTYQLKVSLRGARPPIWRRLRVPGRFTLAQLHAVIQAAFGWEDYHLHVFDVDGSRYAPAGADLGARARDERKVRIAQVAPAVGDRLTYTYDFGDDWEHEIIVEQIVPADGPDQAVCVTGRRAAPPEDCGGVWGYAELCDILADPTHPEYTERREWLGREFVAAAFDPEPVNRALRGVCL